MLFSQNTFPNPYSMFGIGSLYGVNHQQTMAIGGATIGHSSPYFVNNSNPASYSDIDTNSFIIDAALFVKNGSISNQSTSFKYTSGSLGHLLAAFSVSKKVKASMGIVPFTNVSYNLFDERKTPEFGRIRYLYYGNGGINKAYIGGSYEPVKNFSIGINANYLFGKIEKKYASTFPDSAAFFNTETNYNTRVSKFLPEFGLKYKLLFDDATFVQFGASYTPSIKMNAKSEKTIISYLNKTVDTLFNISDMEGNITLPTSIGFGVTMGNSIQWLAAVSFEYQQWSKFNYLDINSKLNDSYKISVGGQYRPVKIDAGSFFKRTYYRAGMHYNKGYLNINDKSIDEIGISFGLGLPMRKSKSTINIAMEVGKLGTTKNNLINDNYFKISLGTSIVERWFVKPKYF